MKNQELWYNMDLNKSYVLSKGQEVRCNELGKPLKKFIPYYSGSSTYKHRVKHSLEAKMSYMIPNIPKFVHRQSLERTILSPSTVDTSDNCSRICIRTHKAISNGCSAFGSRLTSRTTPIRKVYLLKKPFEMTSRSKISDGLPFKPRLHNSTLKTKHLHAITNTFRPMNNLNSFDEKVIKYLKIESDNEVPKQKESMPRSYKEVQQRLKKELIEAEGYQEEDEIDKPISFKGLYSIHIPTEGELQTKSKKRRELINPKMNEEERRYEALDLMLLKKGREQRILKNNALKSLIRSKERKLEKEIAIKNRALMN